jgi:hypothetical protein
VTDVTKARLISLVIMASLFAFMLAWCWHGLGMSDGGGLRFS